jgi:uncharacterized membrane protein
MKSKEFLNKLEHEQIVQAIKNAEANTSGEIRLYIHRGELKKDPVDAAQDEFVRLGMTKTQEQNGVLIYIAPQAQEFAVIGGEEIHQRCGEELWQIVADKMSEQFGAQRFSDGIVEAITYLGGVLSQHFPRRAINPNELPDEIIED